MAHADLTPVRALLVVLVASAFGCSSVGAGPFNRRRNKQIPRTQTDDTRSRRISYLQTNLDRISKETTVARGSGLWGYADLRGCEPYAHGHLGRVLQRAHQTIWAQPDAMSVYARIEDQIAADSSLSRACGGADPGVVTPGPTADSLPPLRLSQRLRAVVLPLGAMGGLPSGTAEMFTGMLVAELSRVENFEALGPKDVDAVLRLEKNKDLAGCDETACAAEIGGALASDLVLHGDISVFGTQYVVVLNVIETSATKVRTRIKRSIPADDDLLHGLLSDIVSEFVVRMNIPPG